MMDLDSERENFAEWISMAEPVDKNVGMVEHKIKTDAAWAAWAARAAAGDFFRAGEIDRLREALARIAGNEPGGRQIAVDALQA